MFFKLVIIIGNLVGNLTNKYQTKTNVNYTQAVDLTKDAPLLSTWTAPSASSSNTRAESQGTWSRKPCHGILKLL